MQKKDIKVKEDKKEKTWEEELKELEPENGVFAVSDKKDKKKKSK